MAEPTGELPLVADIVPRIQLRGAEVFAQHLAAALADRYLVRTFPMYGGDRSERVAETRVSPGVGAGPASAPRAVASLRRRIRAVRPDLVVAHGGDPLRAAVAARLHRTAPLVYVRVSSVPPPRRRGVAGASLRAAYRRARAVVAVSESLGRELVESFGVPPERVRVIPNARPRPPALSGPERERVRAELGAARDTVLVVWVGSLVPEKRPSAAVELARAVARDGTGIRTAIVGGGPLERAVRAEAEGVPGLVVAGERADAARLIACADVVVSTSATEGAPGVLVEAMVAGVPVVTPDVGGIREAVDEASGVLVPAGDGPALAAAVAGLVADPELRARLARGARDRGRMFDIAVVAPRYDALYRELLQR